MSPDRPPRGERRRRHVSRPSSARHIDRSVDKPTPRDYGLDEQELRAQRPPHWG